jgi:hypothetical protein
MTLTCLDLFNFLPEHPVSNQLYLEKSLSSQCHMSSILIVRFFTPVAHTEATMILKTDYVTSLIKFLLWLLTVKQGVQCKIY